MSQSYFRKWCQGHLKKIKMQRVVEASEEKDSWHLISKHANYDKGSKKDIQTYNKLKFPSSTSASRNRILFSGTIPIQEESLDYISPDIYAQCKSSNNIAKIKNALNTEKDAYSTSNANEEAKSD